MSIARHINATNLIIALIAMCVVYFTHKAIGFDVEADRDELLEIANGSNQCLVMGVADEFIKRKLEPPNKADLNIIKFKCYVRELVN